MDEQGFIFTTDATLALVVMIVFTASIVTYGLLPVYQGQNHQHLEALADSALETMEQDGTLRIAAVQYSSGDTSGAQSTLNSALSVDIPDNVGYKFTMTLPSGDQTVTDDNGVLTSNDVATKVKVVSGPQQGWMGRAYYKQDQVLFQNINSTSVTTLWNFHNYLKNFGPWSGGLNTYKYWGGTNKNPQAPIPINFSMPGPPNSAQFLLGSAAGSGAIPAYGANVTLNGNNNYILNSSFKYVYTSAGVGPIYNYQKNISASSLNSGLNNFFVQFNATSNQNMPWFTIIANYTTSVNVPVGIANDTIPFPDIAGIGRPGPGNTGVLYDLDSGSITPTPGRTVTWAALQNNFAFDTSTPFELTGLPNIGIGSAVATVQDINLQSGNRLFDAFTVVNAFGGEDGCIVQVQDSTGTISTVFSSFGNTARSDGGYGNVPGILNIQPYLKVGHNKVRIITWDDVPGNDYDLVGLQSCYSKITYSKFPIRWDTFPFDSHQNTSNNKVTTETQTESFKIDGDAQNAYLFVGVGTATRNITVTITNSTGGSSVLYKPNEPIPYYIDLGARDANATQPKHIMTSMVGNGSSLIPGTYTLTVSVIPALAYESGDGSSSPPAYGYSGDPSIFSGTRISVIYPKFLQNIWATGFAPDANTAANNAIINLKANLAAAGYTNIDPTLIRNTTLWTGDVPNAIPVRLDLWTQ
jgi:hypothetical protein